MSINIIQTLVVAVAAAMGTAAIAIAQTPAEHAGHHAPSAPAAASMSDGEVRKVDKDAGKITLKHGPIPALDMPEMTMVFRVTDKAMLEQFKAGDKVRFTADKVGGQYTVTSIESRK